LQRRSSVAVMQRAEAAVRVNAIGFA